MKATLAQADAAEDRAQHTRHQLMEAAERLLGRMPIDQVSLMAIGREAGQGNKSVVQYHFGTLEGLLNALMQDRVAHLESRREVLLKEAETGGRDLSVRDLLEIMWRPITEIVDQNGHYTFARFLLQWTIHAETWVGVMHPILREQPSNGAMVRMVRHLTRLLPDVPRDVLTLRLVWSSQAFLSGLVEFENGGHGRRGRLRDLNRRLDDVLTFSEAGLAAPIKPASSRTRRNKTS